MMSLVCKLCTVFNLKLGLHCATCIRFFLRVCVYASHHVRRLGQLVPFLNSQSHQITHCALRGANSSHKMLKHYLGGRKQLDSLESGASRQAATGMGGGGREKTVGKRNWGGKHSVHYKLHLTVCSIWFCPPFCLPLFKLLSLMGNKRDQRLPVVLA